MRRGTRQREANSKRRIGRRLRKRNRPEQPEPMVKASNIHYNWSDRDGGRAAGGLGADVEFLMDRVNRTRLRVWRKQPESSFAEVTSDWDTSDGDLVNNWAHMIMASLAGRLNVWSARPQPGGPRRLEKRAIGKQTVLRSWERWA